MILSPQMAPVPPVQVDVIRSGLMTTVQDGGRRGYRPWRRRGTRGWLVLGQSLTAVQVGGFVVTFAAIGYGAALSMVVGVLGAIAQNDMKRILSFHIVSQIGYMILGVGLFTLAGIAGAIFYVVHHIIVKTTLFLTDGLVELRSGTGSLSRLGGLVRSAPVLAALFLIPALSLAGIPPLSGFVAKYALVDAGLDARQWGVVAVSLVVSLLTLFSMTKIWAGAFWGDVEPADTAERSPAIMVGATATLTAMSLAVALFAGPLYALSERAAADLIDPSPYIQAVLG